MNIDLQTPSNLWDVYHQPAENKGDGQEMAIATPVESAITA